MKLEVWQEYNQGINKIEKLASHKDQTLPGKDIPYINHIANVAMEVIAAITALPVEKPDLAMKCALLHDVIEDTDSDFDQVKKTFGKNVAMGTLDFIRPAAAKIEAYQFNPIPLSTGTLSSSFQLRLQ